MATYKYDQGNDVELPTPDEVKALQEKATALEEKAAKADELEKSISEKEDEIRKLQNKDMNFDAFRRKSEEEKKKLLDKMTSKERMIMEELDAMKTEKEMNKKLTMDNARSNTLDALAGRDVEKRKRIEMEAKDLIGAEDTPEQLSIKLQKAAAYVEATQKGINPLHAFSPATGMPALNLDGKQYVDTEQGKEVYKSAFGHYPGEHNKKAA
jgi:hypothetical protein